MSTVTLELKLSPQTLGKLRAAARASNIDCETFILEAALAEAKRVESLLEDYESDREQLALLQPYQAPLI